MQAVIFTFHEFEFLLKKFFSCAISLDKVVGIFFEKTSKNKEAQGHRALCSPRAGSVFALVQRRWLVKLRVVVMKRTQSGASSELNDM
jgi:hypothetical protein